MLKKIKTWWINDIILHESDNYVLKANYGKVKLTDNQKTRI